MHVHYYTLYIHSQIIKLSFLAMNRTVCHVLTLEQKSAGNFMLFYICCKSQLPKY